MQRSYKYMIVYNQDVKLILNNTDLWFTFDKGQYSMLQ